MMIKSIWEFPRLSELRSFQTDFRPEIRILVACSWDQVVAVCRVDLPHIVEYKVTCRFQKYMLHPFYTNAYWNPWEFNVYLLPKIATPYGQHGRMTSGSRKGLESTASPDVMFQPITWKPFEHAPDLASRQTELTRNPPIAIKFAEQTCNEH